MKQEIQQALGVFLGVFTFLILANIIAKFFEKRPEEIAKEKCLQMVNAAKILIREPIPISVTINGQTYQCKWNE
jgi:hypothetical protein